MQESSDGETKLELFEYPGLHSARPREMMVAPRDSDEPPKWLSRLNP
jgi:hypothetical protein